MTEFTKIPSSIKRGFDNKTDPAHANDMISLAPAVDNACRRFYRTSQERKVPE